jgi:hypothetical protein
MSLFWQGVIQAALRIFTSILGMATPVIKAELSEFLTQLYKKALATPNPWDDFAVGLLLDILAITRPPPE